MTRAAAGTTDETTVEVHRLLDEFEGCWSSLDFERLSGLWDHGETDPIYQPEEHREPFIGLPAIEKYWEATRTPLRRARVRTWNRQIRQVAGDICIAFFEMRWMVELKPDGPLLVGSTSFPDGHRAPVGGDVRASAVLRRRPTGWRFIHYVEAPLGFLTQLATMHEGWVDDDFLNVTDPS